MSLLSMLNRFNEGVAAASNKLRQSSEITRATSDLSQRAYAERYTIETALKLARTDLEYREHMKRPEFRQIHERIRTAMDEARPADAQTERVVTPSPDFNQVPTHPDAAIALAILEAVQSMAAERDQFLADVRKKLTTDSDLQECFVHRMEKLAAERYLPALALPRT